MSELRFENWTVLASELGVENPLPPLSAPRDLHAIAGDESIPAEMLRNMAYGHLPSILPYPMQDAYSRELKSTQTRVAVLENDLLRAAFLLEYGGRLWSLIHKPSSRELLSTNPTIQIANLALRNAWFSGGVEWNIGTIGHSPFTCAPLFAARLTKPDGTPVLRLYEWERMRQVPFQIDAFLPDGSPVLYIAVRIINPHDQAVPMYWWSNIAVPETPKTRVLAPAESVYHYAYQHNRLERLALPAADDFTYPMQINQSADYFFQTEDNRTPWIAALDGAGQGLVQVSTRRLTGRKLFLWGMGSGGRRWQQWLAPTSQPYIEIQAGLARTQMEHLPMPARSEWTWLEAYGLLEADAAAVHGTEWQQAWQAAGAAVERLVHPSVLNLQLEQHTPIFDCPPDEIVQRGSGWGALEQKRREAAGERVTWSNGLVFDEASLTEAQSAWLRLLEDGVFEGDDLAAAGSFMMQADWHRLMESAATEDRLDAGGWLHLGVMRYYAGDPVGAGAAWQQSLRLRESAFAYRNLAMLAQRNGDHQHAAVQFQYAHRLQPELTPLAIECAQALIAAGQSPECIAMIATLPESMRKIGRIQLLEAMAALNTGDLSRVEAFFASGTAIADIREGDTALSDLWYAYQLRRLSTIEGTPPSDALRERVINEYPVPSELDFRMKAD